MNRRERSNMMHSKDNADIRKRNLLGSEHDFLSVIMNVRDGSVKYFLEGKTQHNKIDGIVPIIAKAAVDDLSYWSSEWECAFQLVSQSQAGQKSICHKILHHEINSVEGEEVTNSGGIQ
jgi:hypothetical protein